MFEEFAFRQSHFGALCTTQQLDLVIDPIQIKTDPQIVALDLQKHTTGFVKQILPVNSDTVYTSPPGVDIKPKLVDGILRGKEIWASTPPETYTTWDEYWMTLDDFKGITWSYASNPSTGEIIIPETQVSLIVGEPNDTQYYEIGDYYFDHAQAVGILDDEGYVVDFEILHPGSGYTQEPDVYIPLVSWDPRNDEDGWSDFAWDGGTDRAIAILGFEVTPDSVTDDIVLIDKDDTEKWLSKPTRGCDGRMLWGTIEPYNHMPVAGFINENDVNLMRFNGDSLLGTTVTEGQYIGIARNLTETWDVYKVAICNLCILQAGGKINLFKSTPCYLNAGCKP